MAWYGKHLGLKTDQYDFTFWWKDKEVNDCSTQWSPFIADTNYFETSEKQFMQNFRVDDLEQLLKKLSDEGVTIIGVVQSYEYGILVGYLMSKEIKSNFGSQLTLYFNKFINNLLT